MSALTRQKLNQAAQLVAATGTDAWITFVRESVGGSDPVLPLILDGGLTWQSALIVTRSGHKVAVLGNYDADPLISSGDWDEVIPYVHGIREPLVQTLEKYVPAANPKIAVNYSVNDDKADGLTVGMLRLLESYLEGTRFTNLVSAEEIVVPLRSVKAAAEIEAMKSAIAETERIFHAISSFAKVGTSERSVYEFVHGIIKERGLGFAWDPTGDPIVNSGPDSMIGHGIASSKITIQPGHIFHIDLGVVKNSYSSDIQRCWYVASAEEADIPEDVRSAFHAVNQAITDGASMLKVGARGWEVDAAARASLTGNNYPEYMHAFGHQVGRVAHDGGALLGPRWDRYGNSPEIPIRANEVYTLELGVVVPGRGYLGLEEMVVVRETGNEWLTDRQLELPILRK